MIIVMFTVVTINIISALTSDGSGDNDENHVGGDNNDHEGNYNGDGGGSNDDNHHDDGDN